MKPVRLEAYNVRVSGASRGSQQLEVIHGLQKIRLALPIVADKDKSLGRNVEVHGGQVSEVADRDAADPRRGLRHAPVNFAGRFWRNARVPSCLSCVVASVPNAWIRAPARHRGQIVTLIDDVDAVGEGERRVGEHLFHHRRCGRHQLVGGNDSVHEPDA